MERHGTRTEEKPRLLKDDKRKYVACFLVNMVIRHSYSGMVIKALADV